MPISHAFEFEKAMSINGRCASVLRRRHRVPSVHIHTPSHSIRCDPPIHRCAPQRQGPRFLHKLRDRRAATIRDETQVESPSVQGFISLLSIGAQRPRPYFDGCDNRDFMIDTLSLTLGTAAYKRFIHLNWLIGANQISIKTHQAGTQLV